MYLHYNTDEAVPKRNSLGGVFKFLTFSMWYIYTMDYYLATKNNE